MKIPQLLQRINAQWPFPGSDALDIAYEDYRGALGRYQGPKLQQAWDETIATWRSANRPLPADIAAHLPTGTTERGGPRIDWDEVKRIQHGMVTDWWRDNQDAIDGFLAQFVHDDRDERLGPLGRDNWRDHLAAGTTDRLLARGKLNDLLTAKAWLEAQRRHMALPMQGLEVKTEDYERIRGQVRSQTGTYPKRVRDLGLGDVRERPITPRYVPRTPAPSPAIDVSREISASGMPDGRPMPPIEADPFGIQAST
jgi:hypothetical protein